jgi:UDP:flavonoid glycosyltransferase YjiC (YdhE family)
MRVLLACSLGGIGHLTPLLSLERAARRAGHETLVLVPPSLADEAARHGVLHRVGDEPPRELIDDVWGRVRAGPPQAVVGLIDRELFADACAQAMLPTARELVSSWRPGLVLHEPCEYASAVVAHETGTAQAEVGISLAVIERGVLEMVTPIIEGYGPGVADAIRTASYLSSFPASLDPSPWGDTRRFREPASGGALRDWWPSDDRPLVYMTFGSVIGHLPEAAEVYRTALDAASGLPARVLLTVGRETDLGSLGAVPENGHVEQWVPQADAVAEADVVVCHGGSGTTFGALAAGVPLVICPLFADQRVNARVAESAGAAIVAPRREVPRGALRGLGPADVDPLREAIERVLAEPAYRRAAKRIAAEMAEMPTVDEVVGELISR